MSYYNRKSVNDPLNDFSVVNGTVNDKAGVRETMMDTQNFIKQLRSVLLAGAGAAAMTPFLWGNSAFAQSQYYSAQTIPTNKSVPAQTSGHPEPGRLQLTAGRRVQKKSNVQQQLEALYQQNGQQAPQMQNAAATAGQQQGQQSQAQQPPAEAGQPRHQLRQQRRHGNAPQARTQAQPISSRQYPQPMQQKKPGFMDRLLGTFKRSNAPSRPPIDPGMRYPTASSQQGQLARQAQQNSAQGQLSGTYIPPPAPGVQGFAAADRQTAQLPPAAPPASLPPAIPPVNGIGTSQPRLLEASQATPIASTETTVTKPAALIPPAPGEEFVPPPRSQVTTVSRFPEQIPELDELLKIDESPMAPSIAVTPPASITPPPVFTPPAEAQIPPEMAITPMPESKTDPSGKVPTIDFNAPLAPEPKVEVAQAPVPEPEPKNDDPFMDLFPEDTEADTVPAPVATAPKQAPKPASNPLSVVEAKPLEEVEEEPYTGLELEEDLFMSAKPSATTEETEGLSPANSDDEEMLELEIPELPLTPLDSDNEPSLAEVPESENESEGDLFLPPTVGSEAGGSALTTTAEAPTLKPVEESPTTSEDTPTRRSRQEIIASRSEQSGLKGFCPVMLRDHRDLVNVKEDYSAIFNGKRYEFSSEEALEIFLNDPGKYAPASQGNDVIHLALTGEANEGKLDHAVWYKGRLYLFNSVETMETFVAAPNSHATDE